MNEKQKIELINSFEKEEEKKQDDLDSSQIKVKARNDNRLKSTSNENFSSYFLGFVYRLIIAISPVLVLISFFSYFSSKKKMDEANYSFANIEVNEIDDSDSSFSNFLEEFHSIDYNSKKILEDNFFGSDILSYFRDDKSKNMVENMLFYGAPGTGKSYAAKKIAEKFSCGYFFVSGGSFERVFVGSGAERLEMLMSEVKKFAEKNKNLKKPVFLIIDEVDSVGLKKSSFSDSTLTNTFLTEIDSLKKYNVVVVATTNDFSQMEEASIRPGRFSCKIKFSLPSEENDVYKICYLSINHLKKELGISKLEFFEGEEVSPKLGYIQISENFLRLLAKEIFGKINYPKNERSSYYSSLYPDLNIDNVDREKISIVVPNVADLIKFLLIKMSKEFFADDKQDMFLIVNEAVFEKNCEFIKQRIDKMI